MQAGYRCPPIHDIIFEAVTFFFDDQLMTRYHQEHDEIEKPLFSLTKDLLEC